MNEVVEDGRNGLLVPGQALEAAPALGHRLVRPGPPRAHKAIESLRDPDLRAALREGAIARREELSWDRTVEALERLITPEGESIV